MKPLLRILGISLFCLLSIHNFLSGRYIFGFFNLIAFILLVYLYVIAVKNDFSKTYMTLSELTSALSKNRDISLEYLISNGICHIVIKDYKTQVVQLDVKLTITEDLIDVTKFLPYVKI